LIYPNYPAVGEYTIQNVVWKLLTSWRQRTVYQRTTCYWYNKSPELFHFTQGKR